MVVEWLMTLGVVWLGGRCIRPDSKLSTVFVFAALCTTTLPILFGEFMLVGVGLAAPRPEQLYVVVARTLVSAVFVVNFQAFIVMCILAADRSRRAAASLRTTASARAAVLLGSVAFALFMLIVREPGTLPGLTVRQQVAGGLPLQGRIAQYTWDVEYFFLEARDREPFALSVNEGQSSLTRLLINGQELTDGMLLVSPWSQLTAAVASEPGRDVSGEEPRIWTHYHYELHQEPLRGDTLGALDVTRWALVQLPLERIGEGAGGLPIWQVTMKGQLSPAQQEAGRRVHMYPVLVNLAPVGPGACIGVSIAAGGAPGYTDTFVLTNRADSGRVPRPDPEADRFIEGLRLWPTADGAWSTTLVLTPIVGFRPQKCERASQSPEAVELLEPAVPDLYGPRPSLVVAVKLY